MINIVYMGTPEIAVKALRDLAGRSNINVLAVITPPDKPQGRKMIITPPPIKVAALENNIQVFQTKSIRKDENLIKKLKDLKPDFFVTFAFGQILSQEVLDIPKFGTVNVHASLLPKYRGANPIQHAIVNGDKITGITTMLTSLGMDEGDMCLKTEIEIPETMTDETLREKIEVSAPPILYETITKLYNKELTPIKQRHENATYAGKFTKEDCKIDFNDTAENIHNKVRGLYSMGCFFEHKGKRIKVLETSIDRDSDNIGEGIVCAVFKNGISIGTKDGCIVLKQVQPESKNKMPSSAWNNSAHLKIGDFIC